MKTAVPTSTPSQSPSKTWLSDYADLLAPIDDFLGCKTPATWLTEAVKPEHLSVIMLDHLHCELKAAQSAALLIRRYAMADEAAEQVLAWLKPYEEFVYRGIGDGDFSQLKRQVIKLRADQGHPLAQDLVDKMVLLIKEELHHFEQVLALIRARNIAIEPVTAARYAKQLRQEIRTYEPAAFIDKLIVGAYIEARSCERFAALAPYVDEELSRFYLSLLRSEARHYQDYLQLAEQLVELHGRDPAELQQRLTTFGHLEATLISTADPVLRFHSGVPVT